MNLNRLLTILSQSKLPHSSSSVTFPTSYCKVFFDMLSYTEYLKLDQMIGIEDLHAEFIGDDICHNVSFRVKSEDGNFELSGF